MLVKFGMDTEQIVANATNMFWMHSFISGHKKFNIYLETMFPSCTLQCSLPVNIRIANHIAVALWLTAGAPPATRGSRVKGGQWASSTGLTAVSNFKPRLPAQWTVGTHRNGPSRMEKVTSRTNWPIRNSTQIRITIYLKGNTIMWNPSPFFIFNRFYETQNNFGPLNDHVITEFSWVVTMAPAVPRTDILRWPVTSQWPSSRRLKLWRIYHIR